MSPFTVRDLDEGGDPQERGETVPPMSPFTPASEFDRAAWLDIMERSPGCSLELHPDLMGAPDAGDLPPLVYADRRGGELRTLAVLEPKAMSAIDHPRLKWLGKLAGYRLAGHTLAGTLDREAAEGFLDAVAQHLGRTLGDLFFFEDVDLGTPLWDAIEQRRRDGGVLFETPHEPQSHWRIRFPDKPADYWGKMSRKSRYNTRRAARQFSHEVERFSAPDEVERFLDSAEHISHRSWQGRRLGVRMQRDERHLTRLRTLARLGTLRSYVLRHEDSPVAFVYGWQWNGRFEYEEIGYDSAFADQQPGRVLLFRVLEDLIADDCPQLLDFGCGDAVYKRIFGTDEGESGPAVLVAKTLKTRLWTGLRQGYKSADQGARALLRRSGLYERARRLYRRAGADT